MRRRAFITFLGGAAASPFLLPPNAHAQQPDRVRQVGVLMGYAESDPVAQERFLAFRKALQELGWAEGRNVQFEVRWAAGDAARRKAFATELVRLKPDVIVANTGPVVAALRQATTTVPIVYASGADPVASGFVANLARPGGNITGFSVTEPSLGGKWLNLLKELAPAMTRAAIVLDSANTALKQYLNAIDSVNARLKLELQSIAVQSDAQVGKAIDAFSQVSNGAILVLPGAATGVRRHAIITAAARNRLPAIYPFHFFAVDGGLVAYGADQLDLFRRAASYVDRILRGESPAILPIQQPTKFEMTINLRTARSLGLEVPPLLAARADKVIE